MKFKSKMSYLGKKISILPWQMAEQLAVEVDVKKVTQQQQQQYTAVHSSRTSPFILFGCYILYTICYMLYAICYMLNTKCYMLYAIYYMLYAIFYMLYAICYMLYAICYMLYAICYMLYAICYMLVVCQLSGSAVGYLAVQQTIWQCNQLSS